VILFLRQPLAQVNLGGMYDIGKGVTQDYSEALKWYRKAAEQGHASAQFYLGAKYANGQGVARDYVSSHMWINLAVSRASGEDPKEFAKARDTVASLMSPAQIAEAQKLAGDWKPITKK